jgi:hypothetical protein
VSVDAAVTKGVDHPAGPEFVHVPNVAPVPEKFLNVRSATPEGKVTLPGWPPALAAGGVAAGGAGGWQRWAGRVLWRRAVARRRASGGSPGVPGHAVLTSPGGAARGYDVDVPAT